MYRSFESRSQKWSLLRAILVAILLGCVGHSEARTIQWGGAAFDRLIQSDGQLVTASFSFQLGTFGDSFVPSLENAEDWSANWKLFDDAKLNEESSFFSSSAVLLDNEVFLPGEKAYLWIFNATRPGPTAEWALLSNVTWEMPEESDPRVPTLEWRVSSADQAYFGGVNGESGPGERRAPESDFVIQLHTFPAIPEPSTTLVLGAGLLVLTGTRRRFP